MKVSIVTVFFLMVSATSFAGPNDPLDCRKIDSEADVTAYLASHEYESKAKVADECEGQSLLLSAMARAEKNQEIRYQLQQDMGKALWASAFIRTR